MGLPADELAERMSEAEFREHMEDRRSEPDLAGKLDVLIALLVSIFEANTSLAASWVKGYQAPKIVENVPAWGRKRKKKAKFMDPSIVLATVRSFQKPPQTLSG